MGAIVKNYNMVEVAVKSLYAGSDIINSIINPKRTPIAIPINPLLIMIHFYSSFIATFWTISIFQIYL